jgi:serine/threonine-protein kinase
VELAPGTVLLGKYRIEELIGSGGMGNVVRASHLYLHQSVAIKILLPEMAQSESTKQRFLREAQATVKLKSEHSARVMDVGTTPEGLPFMVMEFLDGNDLNQILRHHGPQVPSIVVDLMLQACEGIAEAHALGIVHRDVKPSNFFITRRPDGSMLLKILDFGISKTPVDYGELTGTQTVIGTPSYMAPEQMKSGRSADPRSDIWSMGVVMYQLIAGHPPFSGESYADLVLKVGLEPPAPLQVPLPNGLVDVIMRCLEKDPRGRHQNVGELARMLAPYATDPISAAQAAGRAMRILQQRGVQLGMQGSPLTAGGGLSGHIPISPAQLTPRSWPPSQGTSLSQGTGQMTPRVRSSRGLLIAGVTTLCILAGVGGYAVSQVSKPSNARGARNEPHVQAPPPTPAAQPPPPPAASPPTAAPSAAAPSAAAPPAASPPAASPPAASPPTASPPTASPPAASPSAASPPTASPPAASPPAASPSAASPPAALPSAASSPAATPASSAKPAASKPAVAKPTTKPDAFSTTPPASTAATKPAVAKPTTKPDAFSTTQPASTAATKPAPGDARPATKPAKKPSTRPKKPDSLFDSRH